MIDASMDGWMDGYRDRWMDDGWIDRLYIIVYHH